MHGFHLFVRTLGVRNIRDTQCGFKLFTRETAAVLFERMHLERWSFDVELLVLADACRVKEGAKDVCLVFFQFFFLCFLFCFLMGGLSDVVFWTKTETVSHPDQRNRNPMARGSWIKDQPRLGLALHGSGSDRPEALLGDREVGDPCPFSWIERMTLWSLIK